MYEFLPTKSTDFPLFASDSRFTDDTVLTVAVADCLLNRAGYVDKFHEYTLAYPHRAYGLGFYHWVHSGSREPYNSWGNGSAMRVSPVAYAFETLEQALHEAKASAEVTHNHPEGIRGAIAVTMAIFMARRGESKDAIRRAVHEQVGYDLTRTAAAIRETYKFNESCQGRSRKPSWRSSMRRTTKMQFGLPFRWVATPTRSPTLPVESPQPFMEEYLSTSRSSLGAVRRSPAQHCGKILQPLRDSDPLRKGIGRFGGADRDRTGGLVVANDALSQLSYSPTSEIRWSAAILSVFIHRTKPVHPAICDNGRRQGCPHHNYFRPQILAKPSRTCTVFRPGLGTSSPAFEMCIYRTSTLQV